MPYCSTEMYTFFFPPSLCSSLPLSSHFSLSVRIISTFALPFPPFLSLHSTLGARPFPLSPSSFTSPLPCLCLPSPPLLPYAYVSARLLGVVCGCRYHCQHCLGDMLYDELSWSYLALSWGYRALLRSYIAPMLSQNTLFWSYIAFMELIAVSRSYVALFVELNRAPIQLYSLSWSCIALPCIYIQLPWS